MDLKQLFYKKVEGIYMKLKGKKINGIDKNVCCAEQKIAYNWAFHYSDILKNIENTDAMEFVKADARFEIRDKVINYLKTKEEYKKYNLDIIFCALSNDNLKKYMEGYSILTSYEEIGNIFKVHHEIV